MEENKNNDDNENNFDFEILTYSSSKEISNSNNSNIKNKESNSEDILKQNLNCLIRNIHNIIFDSRGYGNNFYIKSKKNINSSNNGFVIGLDEALMDKNDFLENNKITNNITVEKRNYILEFYLVNPENKNKTMLIEKWKMGYQEKDENNYNINYVDKTFFIIEKTIMTLTRVLPLFNLLKTKKYIIEFKSFQDTKKNSQRFNKKPSIMELVYPELYDLKIKIEYLNKNEIIPEFEGKLIKKNVEIRNSVPAVYFNKLSKKELIIKNNDNIITEQNSNRRSNFEMHNIINNIIQNSSPDLESSSSGYENCNEIFEDNNKKQINLNRNDLNLSCLSQYKTEYCTPREKNNQNNIDSNLLKNDNNDNNIIKININKNIKNIINNNANNINNGNNINNASNINDVKIKNIIDDFQRCKELIYLCSQFDAFNKNKLEKFVFDN